MTDDPKYQAARNVARQAFFHIQDLYEKNAVQVADFMHQLAQRDKEIERLKEALRIEESALEDKEEVLKSYEVRIRHLEALR